MDTFLACWTTEKTLSPVEDIFNDQLDFACSSLEDLKRLNAKMLQVAGKFKFFDCTEHALGLLREYLANYEVIHALFSEINEAIREYKSDLEAHQNTINTINEEIRDRLSGIEDKNKEMLELHSSKQCETLGLASPFATNIKEWLPKKEFELIYRATDNGWSAGDFHSCCDNKGATLVVIKSVKGHLFGGYTSVGWQARNGYVTDPHAFIFTLTNPHDVPPTKFDPKPNANHIMDHSSYGPTFGTGHDIFVAGQADSANSYTNFPHAYNDTTGKGNVLFTGSREFRASEVEVFAVTDRAW